MREFIILTDSSCDLSLEDRQNYGIEYVKMHVSSNGKQYEADLDWKDISFADFYNEMRKGARFITAQVNSAEYKTAFEKYLSDGKDILYIGCSSGLSGSVRASCVTRDELLSAYPNSKIICIDSLTSCMGLGLICITASNLRAQGKTIDEVASWVEENKLKVHQEATVEKLTWLKQAGRISAASAFFGGLLNVKPIFISDEIGANLAVEKVKGRKNSYAKIAERFAQRVENVEHQKLFVVHGDCENDAKDFIEEIKKALPDYLKGTEIQIRRLGPIIGATCGPGTLGLYYFGNGNLK